MMYSNWQIRLKTKILNYVKSDDLIIIKCGKCEECLHEKKIEIINRIKNELKLHKHAYFLTLTYDNNNVKNLNKRDIQLFLKRYRKKHKVRYIYAGELGETTKRPHYHMLEFGHAISDLKESKTKTKKGFEQYESEELTKLWNMGIVKISQVNEALIHYIVKYMFKNLGEKEFIYGWSRRPPLGINPKTAEKDILSKNRSMALQKWWKYRHKNSLPEIESRVENKKILIEKIEKDMKMPYIQYLKQKSKLKF